MDDIPHYLEAYPMLRIADLATLKKGEGRLRWYLFDNCPFFEIGHADIEAQTSSQVQVKFYFNFLYGDPPLSGMVRLSLRMRRLGIRQERAFICSFSGCFAQRLFYRAGHWACQKCQGLQTRSALMPRKIRWAEEREQLSLELKYGKPPKMTATKYYKKLQRIQELVNEVGWSCVKPDPRFIPRIMSSTQRAQNEA